MPGPPAPKLMDKARPAAKAAVPAPKPAAAVRWDDPIPLPSSETPPPYPLEVLPPSLRGFVESLAEVTATPPDYAATYMLGVSAGLIGATRAVRVGPDWTEMCVLYAIVVAEKSAGKTPVFSAVMRPVNHEQARLARGRLAEDKSPPRLVYVKDFTVEALAPVLKANPRGLLVARDEVSGWASSFNQYKAKGSGSDRQFWLENWASQPIDVLRRNPEAPHIHVAHPCNSIVGGIQPAVLPDLRQDRDDGMIERLLCSYADRLPAVPYCRKPVLGTPDWERAVRLMLALQMVTEEYGPRPYYFRLEHDAELEFDLWTRAVAGMLNDPEAVRELDGTRTKMRSAAARIAIVLHVLWAIEGGDMIPSDVSHETMRLAVVLTRYYLAHAARVHGLAGADDRPGRVLEWAKRHGKPFSRRDAHRALIRQFPKAEDLAAPLKVLAQHGFIQPVREDSADPRSQAVYLIHPGLVSAVDKVSAPGADRLSSEPGAA